MLMLIFLVQAVQIKGPFVLGSPDFVIGHGRYNKNKIAALESPTNALISSDGYLYVMDSKKRTIHKFTLQGEWLLALGEHGEGPGEFISPSALAFFGEDLWVLDRALARVTLFKSDVLEHTFSVKELSRPESMVRRGNSMFIFGSSSYDKAVFLEIGSDVVSRRKHHLPSGLSIKMGDRAGVWSSIKVEPFGENQFLIGYPFYNALGLMSSEGMLINFKEMNDFYERYVGHGSYAGFPKGMAASAFAEGPDGTVFVATCSETSRTCGTVIQLDSSLSKIISKNDYGVTVRKIRYFSDFGLLMVILGGDGEIYFYNAT